MNMMNDHFFALIIVSCFMLFPCFPLSSPEECCWTPTAAAPPELVCEDGCRRLPSLWQANLGSCRGYTSCTFRRKFGVQCVAGVRHWADSYWLWFCATLQVMGGSCGRWKGILMADSSGTSTITSSEFAIIRLSSEPAKLHFDAEHGTA